MNASIAKQGSIDMLHTYPLLIPLLDLLRHMIMALPFDFPGVS